MVNGAKPCDGLRLQAMPAAQPRRVRYPEELAATPLDHPEAAAGEDRKGASGILVSKWAATCPTMALGCRYRFGSGGRGSVVGQEMVHLAC